MHFVPHFFKAIPHNSKCRYGERGAADAVPQLPERCLSRKAGIVRCCLKSFFLPDIQLAGFSSYVFPLVLSPGPRNGFLHLHRYSYYVASHALFLHPRKQTNHCFLYSLFRFFLLFKKQLDKRLCFDYSIANER